MWCFFGFFWLVPLFLIARSSLGRASPQRATDPRTGGGAWPPAPDRGLYKYEASPRGGGHQALFTREEHPSGATDPQNKRRRRKAQRGRPTSKKTGGGRGGEQSPGQGGYKNPGARSRWRQQSQKQLASPSGTVPKRGDRPRRNNRPLH